MERVTLQFDIEARRVPPLAGDCDQFGACNVTSSCTQYYFHYPQCNVPCPAQCDTSGCYDETSPSYPTVRARCGMRAGPLAVTRAAGRDHAVATAQ
jgi:hypothetical protein